MREFIGPLEPHQILCVETLKALGEASSTAALPRRLRIDGQTQMLLRLHRRQDGLPLEEMTAGIDVEDHARWLDGGERAEALTRSPSSTGDGVETVRLTERGHQAAGAYLSALTREMTVRYQGVDPEHLAMVRDACWRIVLNYQRATGT